MSLLLRRQNAQDALEGRPPLIEWKAADYAVIDNEVVVGRIYRQGVHGEPQWLWFLQTRHGRHAGPGQGRVPGALQGMAAKVIPLRKPKPTVLPRWDIYIIRKKGAYIGSVEAVDAEPAIDAAAKEFNIPDPRRLIAVRRT